MTQGGSWGVPAGLPTPSGPYSLASATPDGLVHTAGLVALDAGEPKGDVEGGGAVDGGDGVTRAGEGGHLLLELGDLGAYRGNEVGVDAVDEVLLFVALEDGAVEGDKTIRVDAPDQIDDYLFHSLSALMIMRGFGNTTVAPEGTSSTTTQFAPTFARAPIHRPASTLLPAPRTTPSPITPPP